MNNKKENIEILVTLDKNYIPQLRVLLISLYINHPGQIFDIYLLHSRIKKESIEKLKNELKKINFNLIPITADEDIFNTTKVTDRYPKEMYYRLLAAKWLPKELDKILYLDPDILIINPIYNLWNTNINNYLFAAASHTGKTEMANEINHLRLGTKNDYYNSGVLLINLKLARKIIDPQAIFQFVEHCNFELLLPDQDVLNAMFGRQILKIPDVKWNYDARNFSNYIFRSSGKYNMEWVMKNTSILHFCGREKPWKKNYRRRFGALYKHYMSLTDYYFVNK